MHEDNNKKFVEYIKKVLMKLRPRFSFHYVAYTTLFFIVIFSVVSLVTAATPNPGHPWSEVGDGVFTFTSGQTATNYTYTFPAANTTALTTNAAVTVAQGGTGLSSIADKTLLVTTAANTLSALVIPAGQSIRRNAGDTAFEAFTPGTGMTWPAGGAGIPNYSGSSSWGTSYTTSGSGTVLALTTSPVFTTPSLGVASGTSLAATGVLSSGTNGGTGGQLTLNGSTSGSGILKVSATAGSGIVFQLPSSNGSNTNILQTDGAGVTSWVASPLTAWDAIGDPSGNGSIAMGSTVQTMDWATATTTNPLSLTAAALTTGNLLSLTSNTLTSGSLINLSSSGTGGLTGQKGLNIALSGTNGTSAQTTYGTYISNTHAGTTSTNVGLYTTASGGTTANYAAVFDQGNVGIGTTTPSVKLEVQGLAVNDSPTYSAEFLSGSGWTSTDWTGSFATGWAHTTGNTTVLSQSTPAVSATRYQITYTVTGRTLGTFAIGFGGQTSPTNLSATGAWGPTTSSTAGLTITPTTDFDGTIVISIKSITAASSSLVNLKSSDGTVRLETRVNTMASNQFIGLNSGRYLTTGTFDTGFGNGVLSSVTTGTNNTGMGYISLQNLTTGFYNASFGNQSSVAITSGSYNAALGAGSLYSNTTGGSNVAVGYNSVRNGTAISNSVGVGFQTLIDATGSQNTAVGYASLGNITSGIYNTALGYQSGYHITGGSTPNLTSSNSLYLGASTRASADGDTNEIVIGYSTTGNGSNTATIGNSSILRTYLTGVNLKAGSATAGTAPLKFTSGTVLGTTEAGAVEYDGSHLYFTAANGGSRYQLDQQGGMTWPAGGAGIPNYSGSSSWGTSYTTNGSGTVLALTTAPTFTTSITTPLILGGSSTTSPLTFQTTSGVGTTGADIHFLVGNAGATEAMTILNNGKVGVGNTNPNAMLHIGAGTDTSQSYDALWITNNGDTGLGIRDSLNNVEFELDTWGSQGWIGTKTRHKLNFFTSDSLGDLTIDDLGSVGVGTVSPTGMFQVAQNNTGKGTVSNTAGGTTVTGVNTKFLDTFKIGDTVTIAGQTVAISNIASNTSMTTAAITNANTGVAYTLSGGTRFSVLGNGNVGIGVSTPIDKLAISGTSSTRIGTTWYNATSGTDSFMGSYNGSIQFGGASNHPVWIESNNLINISLPGNGNVLLGSTTAHNTPVMTILNGGNVGIGAITSPTARLNLPSGTATAGTAPLKFTSGTVLGTTEAGAVEYDGSHLYFSAANGGSRYQLDQQSGTGANALGTYIVQSATNAPANAQILGSLGTGIVKNTTTSSTGVLSIAVAGDFPTLNQNTSGAAALTGITNDTTDASAVYPTWVTANTGNLGQYVSSTKLSFVPNTGVLTSTGFAATGVLSSGTNGGTGGQLTLLGATSGSGILKVSATAGSGIVFQLPSSNGSNTNVLQTDGAGVTSWVAAPLTAWDAIADPSGNGSIAFGSTVQTMDWATATTTNPLSITAAALTTGKLLSLSSNTLTSGTLLDITSAGTGALTNQKGLNISLSGANGTASQTTYGAYISNSHGGTTTTNVGLYVSATGGTTANYAAIFENGNVGIGTTSAPAKLTVYDTDATSAEHQLLRMAMTGGSGGVTIGYEANGTNATSGILRSVGNVPLYFSADSSTKAMTILNSGNIGIGTTSPSYKLAVAGTATDDGIRSEMGFDIYTVPDPTAPTGAVSAGGSVDTGAHWYSVSYITATGETHTIYTAAQVTTTAGNNTVTLTIPVSTDPRVTGRKIYRTKVGASSYQDYLVTTIANNTATSYVDTVADSTLAGNASVGYFRTNSTSEYLTVNATSAITIDSKGTYLGYNSGSAITTGGRNVFIGQYAGQGATSANDDVIVGNSAGAGTLTAGGNTLIGSYASGNMTSGGNNTSIGYNANGNLSTGSNNTGLGALSLYGITTQSFNIGVGYQAGRYIADGTTSNTAATSSIYLGSNARASAITQTNEIVIGDTAIGNGSNTATIGSSSLLRTYLTGVNLKAGSSTAGTAPLKFTSGTVLGTTEAGAVEYDGTHLYFTATNGGSRYQLDQQSGGSMSIGGAVTSGTSGSILFVNGSNQLAQNNSTFYWDDTNTQLKIGGGANYSYTTATAAPLNIGGTVDTFLQANIQNKSTGLNASTDWVATADNGTDSTYYIDMGINGSGYTGGVFGAANDAYLYNMGQNLYIGTGTAAKSLSFLTGGTSITTNKRMTIDGSGNITSYLGAGIQQQVTATAALTNDMFTITNTGFAVTTAGASALQVTYVGGASAIEASAARIDTTPGATSGGQWNGLRIVPTSAAASGVVSVGLKLENNGSGILNGVDRAIEISGQGWDSGLNVFETPVAVNSPFGGIGRYQNFLLQSENFATTWTTSNATATANQTGPNSIANSAYSIATSLAGGYVQQSASVGASALTGRTFNFSVWLKAASNITSQLSLTSATPTTPITQNISVGTSWRRYSVSGTFATDAATAVIVRILPTSSGTGTVYAWGAQLEEATSAGVYAATGAALLANTNNTAKNNGIVANNSLKINATSIPTLDMVAIGNQGYGVNAAGVSALQIDFAGGANAIEASAQRIDITGGTTAGSTWNGLRIVQGVITAGTSAQDFKMETAALTQTTAVTTNLRGLNLAVAGTLSTTTTGASNIINWTGINMVTPTLSAGIASSAINADNLKITTSASVTATGTVINNGINIAATGSAGTLNGILVSGITPSTGAETGLNIGSGWDTAIKITDSQATTNSLVNITTSNTAQTGNSLLVQTASTGAPTNGLVYFNFNGARTGAGNGFQVNDASTTAATAMKINLASTTSTTNIGLTIASASTALTTAGANIGSLLNIQETGAMTALGATGSLVAINASGANAVGAVGSALSINIAGTAQLMKGIKFNTASTGNLGTTAGTSGAVLFAMNGAHTGYGLQVSDVTTAGTSMIINSNSLTTGNALSIASSSTGLTTAGTNTGTLFNVVSTGLTTAQSGNLAEIAATTGARTTFSGNLLEVAMTGASASTNTGSLINITDTGAANLTKLLNLSASTTAATTQMMKMTYAGLSTIATTNTYIQFLNSTPAQQGAITGTGTPGNVLYTTTSDARMKHDITDTHFGITDLMNINVHDFVFNADQNNNIQTGFVAQELYKIYPQAVATNGDDGLASLDPSSIPWSIDYGKITPLLVKAIQDMDLKLLDINDMEKPNDWRDSLIAWYSNTKNGITEFVAGIVRAKDQLCIGEGSDAVCITKDDLIKMKASSAGTTTPDVIYIAPSDQNIPDNTTLPDSNTVTPEVPVENPDTVTPTDQSSISDVAPSSNLPIN